MLRVRSIVCRDRLWAMGVTVAAIAGFLVAEHALGQTSRRYPSRSRAPVARESTQPDDAAPDVTRLPTAPMPSLRAPVSSGKKPDVELKEGEYLIEGDAKLPAAQEVNAGNILVKEAFKKSDSAKNEGDYSEIIALCEEGIKSGATRENAAYARKLCAWAYNRRGERFAELGNEQEAMKDFAAAISYDSNHWRAVHNRGVSYATLGKNVEALQDFSRALQINRSYPNTWFNRAELLSDRGDFARAVTDYSEAIRLSPKEAAFYTGRGKALSRLGRAREALQDFNSALRLAPENAQALVSRAELYLASRDWGRAAEDYRDAIQLDDKLGSAYQGAAWIMATCPDERYRNDELAITAAQKALELDGDKDPRYIETLAAAYANAGQYDSAVVILQGHLDKMPQQYVSGAQARIQLYKSERPYRSGPAAAAAGQTRPEAYAPGARQTQPTRQRPPYRQQQAARPAPAAR